MRAPFNVEEYREALKQLKITVQEMDDAIDHLQFEHGTGGVTERATTYLGEFNEAHDAATKAQGEVAKLIVKQLAN